MINRNKKMEKILQYTKLTITSHFLQEAKYTWYTPLTTQKVK